MIATKETNETPPAAPTAASESPPPTKTFAQTEARVLNRLLKMADFYRASQNLRQAEEIYFELIEDHPNSPQAQQARERLLDMCDLYEHAGELHHARSIYERLL